MDTNDIVKIASAVASIGALLISAASVVFNKNNNQQSIYPDCYNNNYPPMLPYGNIPTIEYYQNPYGNPYGNLLITRPNTGYGYGNVPMIQLCPQQPFCGFPTQLNYYKPSTTLVNNNSNELTWNDDPTNVSRRNNSQNNQWIDSCQNYGYGYNDLVNPHMFNGLTNQYQTPFNFMDTNQFMYNQQQNVYNYIPGYSINPYPYRYDYNTLFGYEKSYMTDPYGVQRRYCSKELMNCGYKDSMWMSAPEKETCEYDWTETSHPPVSMTCHDKPPDSDNGVVPLFGPPDWVKSDKFKAV